MYSESIKNETSILTDNIVQVKPHSTASWLEYICQYTSSDKSSNEIINVYCQAISCCPSLDLWHSYCEYIYKNRPLMLYCQTLAQALDEVGFDIRSSQLWRDFLTICVKIYNTVSSIRSTNPLILSDFIEHDEPNQIDDERYYEAKDFGTLENIRQIFADWFSTVTENLSNVWMGYCRFERLINNANQSVATKNINNMELKYMRCQAVHKNLTKLFSHVCINEEATRLLDNTIDKMEAEDNIRKAAILNSNWRDIISYEITNPLNLNRDKYKRRVIWLYHTCLMTCSYHSDLWVDYFIVLEKFGMLWAACDMLKLAIELYLPEDELLQIVLLTHLEQLNQTEEIHKIHSSIIKKYVENSEKTVSIVWVMTYLQYLSRNYGVSVCKQAFQKLEESLELPWEIYITYGRWIWELSGDINEMNKILDIINENKYNSPEWYLSTAGLYCHISQFENARQTLKIGINFHKDDNRLLEELIKLEQSYGSRKSYSDALSMKCTDSKEIHCSNFREVSQSIPQNDFASSPCESLEQFLNRFAVNGHLPSTMNMSKSAEESQPNRLSDTSSRMKLISNREGLYTTAPIYRPDPSRMNIYKPIFHSTSYQYPIPPSISHFLLLLPRNDYSLKSICSPAIVDTFLASL